MTDLRWQLPDGVDELLPPRARQLEHLRRQVLDVFHRWGFDLIDPPVIEYLDALLAGSGSDLDLQTLKVTDQRSGRLLGVRADMTSQAVRIDARRALDRDDGAVSRLCYAGVVVHANPQGVHETRVPIKAGAEIFGAPGAQADGEAIALMLDVLAHGGIERPVLVLGHMGVFNALIEAAQLTAEQQARLFQAVQIKSETDIAQELPAGALRDALVSLPNLMGAVNVLDDARAAFRAHGAAVLEAIDALAALAAQVSERNSDVDLRVDLSELAGFGYHNGPIYSAYHAELGRALARGGRYDGLGRLYGKRRSATGFDVSLKPLLATQQSFVPSPCIWVSHADAHGADAPRRSALWVWIREQREAGQRVLVALTPQEQPTADCNRRARWNEGGWHTEALSAPREA